MEDVCTFALVVELGEHNVPRLKNKLVKHFQSKKRADGGECQIDYEERSGTATLRFRKEEDRARVLAKQSHVVDGLTVTVHLPEEQLQLTTANKKQTSADRHAAEDEVQVETASREEQTEEPALCSTSAVLENIPQDTVEQLMELLVENICNKMSTQHEYSLEILSDICSAVVTFSSGKENNEFITSCQTNRMFLSKKLTVRPLEVTAQVKVEDVSNIHKDVLMLYFENKGWEVVQITPDEEEQSAIISFKRAKDVQGIIKMKHLIGMKPVKVFPFYDSLGMALYGKDRPTLKLPAAFSESINPTIPTYLHKNQEATQMVCSHFTALFCKVDLQPSSVRFSPLPTLLQQKGVKAKDIKEWKDSVKLAFTEVLSRFKTLRLQPPPSAWEECEEQIRKMVLNKAVEVIPDETEGALSVIGLVDDVTRLEPAFNEFMSRIEKGVLRQKTSITQEVNLSKGRYQLLYQDGLVDELKGKYPELKIEFQDKMILNGLPNEVSGATSMVCNRMLGVKKQKCELDNTLFQFLKDEDEEKLTKNVFTSNGIHAAVEIADTDLSILAVSDNILKDAEDKLKQVLISQCIDVEDCNILKNPQWQKLVKRLEDSSNSTSKKIAITTSSARQLEIVIVVGYRDSVIPVAQQIQEHLHKYSQVNETFPVKSDAMVGYIEAQNNTWSDEVKDKVDISFGKASINVKGPREDVIRCKSMFDALISSLFFKEHELSEPGLKEFFKEKEDMYVHALLKDTGCFVQLVDESARVQQDLHPSKTIYQLQTSDGIDIAVSKADLCSYPVDAVVINSNRNLKLDGGIGAAFVKAAGSSLQEECDKIHLQRGQLKPGDCVITGAGGQLHCKNVIHVVGPQYDPSNEQRAVGQLRRAIKGSLELAEMNGCVSLAISAICANMGFSLNLCANTIIKLVKEHCADQYGENTLKQIHFVSTDDHAVQALATAVRDKFGDIGVTTQRGPVNQRTNADKPLGTNVGLSIQLVEGYIEDAKTQGVVNVVGKELDLKKGAVSKAILGAAGPKLQTLVSEQMQFGVWGDVIVTDGCKLKSNMVLHAVVPPWDDQGNALKTMRDIVEDCLNKAELHNLTSITFPAIGTGNLGFPKRLAASVIIEESLKFKKRSLKTVDIMLYPKDRETIQVFNKELKKHLLTTPANKLTTSAPAPTHTRSPSQSSTGLFSKVTSTPGAHEMSIGHVRVQVVSGDITKETTDVIVNSSNESFDLKIGVSKAILDAAGPTVEDECKVLGAQPNTEMILTKPGNLKCQRILHLPGRKDPKQIQQAMEAALLLAELNQYTSVSFPALGTGQGNAQVDQVADAMLDAVVDVVSQKAQGGLKVVRIVIFQAAMMKDFYSRMEKKAAADKQSTGLLGRVKAYILGVLPSVAKTQKDSDFVLDDLQIEPVCFHICGSSQANVNQAIRWITEQVSKEYTETTIQEKAILNLSVPNYKQISAIQSSLSVSVKVDDTSITIKGLSKNVLKATNEIQKVLNKVREDDDIKRTLETISWQYQLPGFQFQNFDPDTNFLLEQAHTNKQLCVEADIEGRVHKVDVPNGPATDDQGNCLEIRRYDILKAQDEVNLPKLWEPMPQGAAYHNVLLLPETPEYTEVLKLFQATCPRPVVKIERTQNALLWKSLQIKRAAMDVTNSHQKNEKRLFHGACHTAIALINQYGFNRSYAGKNAAYFGNGTYFAVNANYSAQDTYSKPDTQGQKHVYLCRVLTGDYTTGTQGMVVPPIKSPGVQYDSVVNDMNSIQMYIIFHDTQACPEYLITFK